MSRVDGERDPGLIVVKVGGAEGNSIEGLVADVAEICATGRRVLIAHGGSAETDALSHALGHPPRFLTSPSGQVSRDTDRRTVELFAQATSLVNRRFVEALRGAGVDALGCSGLDGGLVRARRKSQGRAVSDDGRVRIVRDQWTGKPTGVRIDLILDWLDRGIVPVFAPLAGGENHEMLNVDGDRLAACLASKLGAGELVILSNVVGLLADPEDPSTMVARTDLEQAESLAKGRMKKKILASREALEAGVGAVRIAASAGTRPLSAALAGGGSLILGTPRESEQSQ